MLLVLQAGGPRCARMVDMANHEQAVKCTEIARAAMEGNNLEKARRFADKAMKLHASDEVSSSAPWRHMSSCTTCYRGSLQHLSILAGTGARASFRGSCRVWHRQLRCCKARA